MKLRLALSAKVVWDGVELIVKAEDLVPGDIILLSADNLAPADGLILDAKEFRISEARLTGKLFSLEKQLGIVLASAAVNVTTPGNS